MPKFIKYGCLFVAASIGSEILWQFCRNKKKKLTNENAEGLADPVENDPENLKILAMNTRKPPELWNTVLFFPDPHYGEPGSTSLQLYSYFENAKISIQLCIYLASDFILNRILQRRKRDGLIVQVITDYDTIEHHNTTCRVFRLRRQIPVRTRNTGHYMHNKFVIIDEEAVLTGSLNITKLGICNNAENVVVTTNPRIVARYCEEYAKLWVESKEIDPGRY